MSTRAALSQHRPEPDQAHGLPRFHALGEDAALELRANFFNAFNILNLSSFGFFSPSTDINNANFGRATSALAGRVIALHRGGVD